ncbi:hypothetical protein ACROYT_G024826 [Oculina patagonica]
MVSRRLRYLQLLRNVSSIPDDIFSNFPNIRSLDLRSNNFPNLEENIFANLTKLQTLYIDDIFFIWTHGEEKLNDLFNFCNSFDPHIKFEQTKSTTSIPFLDVQVINGNGKISTDLYTKPTDTHQYLNWTSCHPRHTKTSIPYSLALRLRRICSTNVFFEKRARELHNILLERGYKNKLIKECIMRARKTSREEAFQSKQNSSSDRVPLVVTYNPALPNLHKILKEHQEKSKHSFLVFDIVDFYPSISEELLKLSLTYAKQHTAISEEDVEIIMHSRKTLLFDKDEPWVKRGDSPMFDVAMGCYDGAEVCELVGLYILHKLTSAFPNGDIGLYRDDGLAIFKSMNARSGDKVRKKFSEILGNLGLKITVQSNLKVVNYLDVTLNLTTGKYYPYRKPDNNPLYINVDSNHPPSVIRQIPASISTRISGLSCDAEEFSKTSQLYNDALKSSGYKEKIQYDRNQSQRNQRNRSRNIIWFNPPFSQSVQTNIAKSFLNLVDKHFPKTSKLRKIFNRNNLKVSYSCTTNMANIIKSHNQRILTESDGVSSEKKCNCRNKDLCPLDGACLSRNVIYEATVTTTTGNTNTYIGMTEHEFKTRYNNHKLSFRDRKHSHATVLSKHIWHLKDSNTDYQINWRIIKRANAYKGNPSRCNLCLSEKLCILSARDVSLLNKKSELVTKCRHENKHLSSNKIHYLPKGLFSSLRELKYLQFRENSIQDLPENIFSNLINLKKLELNSNKIPHLPKGLFCCQNKLEYLDLSLNRIQNLPDHLFSYLSKLQLLNLASNNIENLPASVFSNLTNLKLLSIQDNGIRYLPKGLFRSLKALESLLSGRGWDEKKAGKKDGEWKRGEPVDRE